MTSVSYLEDDDVIHGPGVERIEDNPADALSRGDDIWLCASAHKFQRQIYDGARENMIYDRREETPSDYRCRRRQGPCQIVRRHNKLVPFIELLKASLGGQVETIAYSIDNLIGPVPHDHRSGSKTFPRASHRAYPHSPIACDNQDKGRNPRSGVEPF